MKYEQYFELKQSWIFCFLITFLPVLFVKLMTDKQSSALEPSIDNSIELEQIKKQNNITNLYQCLHPTSHPCVHETFWTLHRHAEVAW